MNEELAEKLKRAGFPQTDEPYICGHCGDGGPIEIRYPTLSELIEACGDRFHVLQFLIRGHSVNGKIMNPWNAFPKPIPSEIVFRGDGSTPEEAVANLWIALNENKIK